MTRVSFAGDWNTKNPAAASGSLVVVEQKAERIVVHVNKPVGQQDLQKLVEVVKSNDKIGMNIACEVSLKIQSGLGFDQYLAGLKAIARTKGPSAQILLMAEEILARKTAPV